ncbi:hypothetical protein [Desulfobotulus mexicanus]|uniref:Uncharacterized protein n=1 Tax=Desulfobotulus mexicanus TaxID=2586642 RepID=A0A5S5MD78_9BACT|nr:hypothetical protein [Desulfobotulus mexicanus]TYT73673.1 hypothetical protein FIM25_14060 [Desulfobotulus mexicanus]
MINQLLFLSRLVVFSLLFISLGLLPAAADTDVDQVLRTFSDSRYTRDIKVHGSAAAQERFMTILDSQVYRPTDQQVIRHVKSLPEYRGKPVITHDFRTPGEQGTSVNTDRDVRVLVEVESNRWVEVPTQKWEEVYYREFAKQTRFQGNANDPAALRAHAARYRQMPTDRFHVEASHDYSDQARSLTYERDSQGRYKPRVKADSTIRVRDGGPGRSKVESTPNVVRVKAGEGLLHNPESMSQMYFQKSWGELGAAQAIETQLKNPSLPAAERHRLTELQRMHTTEGLVQAKKAVETLEAIRTSYQKQGYDVGSTPENFRQASRIVKAVKGTSDTDVDVIIRNLQEHGFRDPLDFAEHMRGQTESLKFARKQTPPPRPSTRLQNAGLLAGWVGNIQSIDHRLEQAREGRHPIEFLNIAPDDQVMTEYARKAGIAAIELIPVSVLDAVERGWRVDERAREYIEDMVKRGEAGWETHPAFVMFAATSTITAETIASMTLDPVLQGGEALMEGGRMVWDVGNNFMADFSHAEQRRLLREMRQAAHDRAQEFGLGGLSSRRGGVDGGPAAGEVDVGETLGFIARKNEQWTADYMVRWELTMADGHTVVLAPGVDARAPLRANNPEANQMQFTIPEGFSPGQYTATLRIFEGASGLQVDFAQAEFTISDRTGVGSIVAAKGHYLHRGGKPLIDPDTGRQVENVLPGDILAFHVHRIGQWREDFQVNWAVGGETYKRANGADPEAGLLRFDSTGMTPGDYKVSIVVDTEPGYKRIGYQELRFRLGLPRLSPDPFTIEAALGDHGGQPLNRSVQNGEILAFQSDITFPDGKPETASIAWQVYDAAGEPVSGLAKQDQVSEAGATRNFRFRFQLEDFPDGEYVVGLFHAYLADPEQQTRATYPFTVAQKVRIDRVLITDDPGRQEHTPLISPDDEPLFYAHYSLGRHEEKARITLTARDKASGEIIETVSVERPRPGETPPFRVGLGIPPEKVPVNREIAVEAEIESDSGQRHTAGTTFKKEPYRLVLDLPDSLKSGENKSFSVRVPISFTKPLHVEMSASGEGFSLGHRAGELGGTVGGIATKETGVGFLDIIVTDAEGRIATSRERILVTPSESKVVGATSTVAMPQKTPAIREGPKKLPVPATSARQTSPAPSSTEKSQTWEEKGKACVEKFVDQFLEQAFSRHSKSTQMRSMVKAEIVKQMRESSEKAKAGGNHWIEDYMIFERWGQLAHSEQQLVRLEARMVGAIVTMFVETIADGIGLLPENIRWAEDVGRAVGGLENESTFRMGPFSPRLNEMISRQSAKSRSQRTILGALQLNDPRTRYYTSMRSWSSRVEQGRAVVHSGRERWSNPLELKGAPVSAGYDPNLVPVIVEGETYYMSSQERNRLDIMRRTAGLLKLTRSANYRGDSYEFIDTEILPARLRVNFNPNEREVTAGYVRR